MGPKKRLTGPPAGLALKKPTKTQRGTILHFALGVSLPFIPLALSASWTLTSTKTATKTSRLTLLPFFLYMELIDHRIDARIDQESHIFCAFKKGKYLKVGFLTL